MFSFSLVDNACLVSTSVVDPDPVGSESFSRIRIRKNHSGSEMNFKENYTEKLVKLDNFSTKMFNFKNINSFLSQKHFPQKHISRHNEQPTTGQEYKGKIHDKNIRKKSFWI